MGAMLVLHPRLVLGVDLILVVVLAISRLRTLGKKVSALPASAARTGAPPRVPLVLRQPLEPPGQQCEILLTHLVETQVQTRQTVK